MRRVLDAVRKARGGEFGGLAEDSGYIAVLLGAIAVADLVQISLITHSLGLREYGQLALAISFVTLVGQFFDVRVATATTVLGGRLLRRDPCAAAGIFQLSYLIDLATGVLGFAVVAALAPAVGPGLIGADGASLILLYALSLLASTVDNTSVAVLRLLGRFRLLTAYSTALEALRIALVVGALAAWHSLQGVLAALVVYEVLAGIVNALAAAIAFRGGAETPLTRPALRLVRPERRELLRTVLHTNVLSYARISQVQIPALLIGALAGATQAGVYKVGMAGGAIVGRLSDPPYVALLPRISRLWSAEGPREVRSLIERATRVSIPVMAIVALALIALHTPILRLLGGGEAARSAEGVFVLGIVAQAVSGALFWNTGVLFAASRSRAMSGVAILGAAIQLALVPPLVLAWGATGAAAAFATSVLLTNAVATRLALRALRGDEPGPELEPGAHAETDALLSGEDFRP